MTSAEYMRGWTDKNRSRRYELNKEATKRRFQKFSEYKKTLFCLHCGMTNYLCLQFHHRDPTQKDHNVSDMASSFGWAKMMLEISKCDVLCANCHIIEHARLAQG